MPRKRAETVASFGHALRSASDDSASHEGRFVLILAALDWLVPTLENEHEQKRDLENAGTPVGEWRDQLELRKKPAYLATVVRRVALDAQAEALKKERRRVVDERRRRVLAFPSGAGEPNCLQGAVSFCAQRGAGVLLKISNLSPG